MMLCPQCAGACTEVKDSGGPPIDFCRTCSAAWFDGGELAKRLGYADVPKPDVTLKAELACPRCKCPLYQWPGRPVPGLGCLECRGTWLRMADFRLLKSLGAPVRAEAERPPMEYAAVKAEPPQQDSLRLAALALPVALGVSFLLAPTHFGRLAGWYFGMLMHELGHAVHAWLGGIFAVPTPFAVTVWASLHQEPWMVAIVLILLLLAGVKVSQARSLGLTAAWLLLLGGQVYLSFFAGDAGREVAVTYGGFAGEIYLSAVLISAFHWRLPTGWYWELSRFPFLAWASLVFASSASRWLAAPADGSDLPMGSAMGEGMTGDLDRLIASYGWTKPGIVVLYGNLTRACIVLILVSYALACLRAWREVRSGVRAAAR